MKFNKNKFIKYSVLLLIIISVGVFINQTFNRPTKLNYLLASRVYKAPANTAFTDDNFYKCVVDTYNRKNNTSVAYTVNLTDEQLETITDLNCYGYGKSTEEKIISVNGLEKLVNLTSLYLTDNLITNIDVSKNTKLTHLRLTGNQLTELDVSNNENLIELDIGYWYNYSLNGAHGGGEGNNISELDLSKNVNLKKLYVNNNQLTKLDMSKNHLLEILKAQNNRLDSVNISNCEKLTEINLEKNNLVNIDVSKNIELDVLYVDNNQLTSLDVSKNTELRGLSASNNQLTSLDVSENTLLEDLTVSVNQLESINVVGVDKLYSLRANQNNLKSINVSNNSLLTYLELDRNQLSEIDVSNNVNLITLILGTGGKNWAYEEGNMSNLLTEIDVTKNINLKRLSVSRNNLTNLDVSNNINLVNLNAAHNKLNLLKFGKNLDLQTIDCIDNELSEINISEFISLKYLYLDDNNFKAIDLSKNINLANFSIENNNLTNLDITNNTNLEKLYIENNNLTEINLKNNLLLNSLSIQYNNLRNLDVSDNSKLNVLQANYNPFEYSVGIYFNDTLDLNTDLGFINLPDGKTSSVDEVYYLDEGLNINNNLVSSNSPGLYSARIFYKHNLYQNGASYTGTYNIYVIKATSDKYEINETENYIYTGIDTDEETILNNISLNYGEASIEDNKLLIKYEDKIVKEFDIVNVCSDEYDLTKEYIYMGTDKLNLQNINILNGTSVIENNKLKIKYNDIVLEEYLLISNSSELYKFIDNNIYIGSNVLDIEKIEVTNGTKEIQENKLLIKYKKDLLNEYLIKSINFGNLKTINIYIVTTEDLSYDEFISNITASEGLTYKMFNGESEITEGNVSEGMTLKVYYNNEVIDSYEITDEYLDLSLLNIDEDKELIKNLTLGTTVGEFKEKISTSGNVTIVDKNNNELTDDKLIISGSKVKIELTNDTYEYTLSVKGDVTGTGTSTVSDVAKLYQYLKKKIDMEDCYKEAGNVVSTDNEIKINDVAKLYQFIKKKIESLED